MVVIPKLDFVSLSVLVRCSFSSMHSCFLSCRAEGDAACLKVGRDVLQTLANEIFALPSRADKVGRLVDLPPPTTPLPREKPVRNRKPLTKDSFNDYHRAGPPVRMVYVGVELVCPFSASMDQ